MTTPIRALLCAFTLAALLGLPSIAGAASPQTIYKDAADGSIDGNYSLTDLRAADAAIPADQREYYLWDEIYAAAIARVGKPNAPRAPKLDIVRPVDSNGNGRIDDDEVAAATAKSKAKNKDKLEQLEDVVDEAAGEQAGSDASSDTAAKTASKDDGSGVSWPAVVAVAFVVVIAAVGAWRVLALRGAKGKDQKPK